MSAVGRNISLDARKSFSAHHQTFIFAPLSFTLHKPASCSTAPNRSMFDLAPAALCVYLLYMVCVLFVSSVCDLVPCCDVAGHTYTEQPGREEGDKKRKGG